MGLLIPEAIQFWESVKKRKKWSSLTLLSKSDFSLNILLELNSRKIGSVFWHSPIEISVSILLKDLLCKIKFLIDSKNLVTVTKILQPDEWISIIVSVPSSGNLANLNPNPLDSGLGKIKDAE